MAHRRRRHGLVQLDYDSQSEQLLALYAKGKSQQWDAATASTGRWPVDPEDPMQMDESVLPLFGTPLWEKNRRAPAGGAALPQPGLHLSQFLHGEQARSSAPAHRARRAVDRGEVLRRDAGDGRGASRGGVPAPAVREIPLRLPISKALRALLEQALTDRRWDFTYLGMQVLIEGLALVAFQRNPRLFEERAVPGGERLRHAG